MDSLSVPKEKKPAKGHYIEQDYKLQEINAWGFEEGKATKIILSYF